MAHLPTVAIIGRPNTGKSTLFNRLVGKRVAIVTETPGTTRDIVAQRVATEDLDYLLLDTGGMGGGSHDADLEDDVAAQSLLALAHADLILFTIDAEEELTGSDYKVVDILRKKRRRHVPVLLIPTKCDQPDSAEHVLHEYHALGIAADVIPVSALHNLGIDALRHAITNNLLRLHFRKDRHGTALASAVPRIAIIGKPNVGKSSLVNALMSPADRKTSPRLVSEIPGTTRDASDTLVQCEGKTYTLVDTAGIRRKRDADIGIPWYASLRSIQAIADCDIAVLIIDAVDGVTRQDKRIAHLALDDGKGLIILINKCDALPKTEREQRLQTIGQELSFCHFCPFLATSAKTGEGLPTIFPWIDIVLRNRTRRLPAKSLRTWYEEVAYGKPASGLSTVKHLTQGKDIPPTFVLFTRKPKSIPLSDLRYLEKRLRSTFALEGTPIRWVTKEG